MTTMTEQTTQVYTVFIRATPMEVWDGITKPEFTARYFYGSLIESTYEPGAPYAGWAEDRSQQYVDGEVLVAIRHGSSSRPGGRCTTRRRRRSPSAASPGRSRPRARTSRS